MMDFDDAFGISPSQTFVYIGSPYWHKTAHIRESRIRVSRRVHAELIKLFPETFFYNAIANGIEGVTEETYWHQHGLRMLSLASALIVLQQPGWDKSVGLGLEITYAEPRLPIYYLGATL
jgi:hypothetical protein